MSSLPPLTSLAEIEERFGEKTAQEVRRAANLLVQRQFLYAGDRGVAAVYGILGSNRYRLYFETLFDALGYQFLHSDSEQWVGLLPDPDLDTLPRLRLDHTLILLLLAHTWQEEVQRGATEARALVVTTVNELFDRYRDRVGRHRKEALTPARFLDLLRDFARRGLVQIGAFDPEAQDHQLDIRPMVNRLITSDALTRLERYAPDLEARITQAGEQTDAEAPPTLFDSSEDAAR